MIPVTVIVTIKNEEKRLAKCLAVLKDFQEVIVVDSQSRDKSVAVATEAGAKVVTFQWNGTYPKKRQWCLETLSLAGDWVLFVDADEIVTSALSAELATLFVSPPACAGYFIRSDYLENGRRVRFGLKNKKLALFDKTRLKFPEIDDLDIPGMGEMEGHYQPVFINPPGELGVLKSVMLHDALDDARAWAFRHEKYARWEAGMNARASWPRDPVPAREKVKAFLRKSSLRPELMFLASFILLGGFLDGAAGLRLARLKYHYYQMIRRLEAAKA